MIFRNILVSVFLWWGKKGCFLCIFFSFIAYPKNPHLDQKKIKKKPSIGRYWYRPKAGKKKNTKKGEKLIPRQEFCWFLVFTGGKHILETTGTYIQYISLRLQPDTSTTPLPMRYASMGYTYFYRISFYGIYFYKALKFFSIDFIVVRNTWKYKYTLKQKVKCDKNRF
jgi:hypothetical protein